MTSQKFIRLGLIGSVLAALCCFTPILVILLSAIGLSLFIPWLDFILLPLLGGFLLLLVVGIWQKKSN